MYSIVYRQRQTDKINNIVLMFFNSWVMLDKPRKSRLCKTLLRLLLIGFCFFIFIKVSNGNESQNNLFSAEFIGFFVYTKKEGAALYNEKIQDVYIGPNETPFLPITAIFKDVFDYTVACNIDQSACKITSKPKSYTLQFNTQQKTIESSSNDNTQRYAFTQDQYLLADDQIWISYQLLEKVVPAEFTWSREKFSLSMVTSNLLPVQSLIDKHRKKTQEKILARQALEKERNALLANPVYSNKWFNSELKYQLSAQANVNYPEDSDMNYVAQQGIAIDTNSKIWKGNLIATGSANFDSKTSTNTKDITNSLSWVYEFKNQQPYFSRLAIGDISSNPNLFFNTLQLKNAIIYDRLGTYNPKLQFYHEDFTLPQTEIEVYRGPKLIDIFFVDDSGKYVVQDPDASPGDVFTLKFYYPNGEQDEQTFAFAPTGNILKQHQFDTELISGELDKAGAVFNNQRISQGLFRYGVLERLTLGMGILSMPVSDNDTSFDRVNIPYLDVALQPFDSIGLTSEILLNGNGYALQGVTNVIPKNFLKINYYKIDDTHWLLKTTNFSKLDVDEQLDISNTTYLSGNWQLLTQYINEAEAFQIKSNLSTYITSWLAPTIGIQHNNNKGNSPATNLFDIKNSLDIYGNLSAIVGFDGDFISTNAQSLVLSYRQQQTWRYNLNFNRSESDDTNYDYGLSINWTPTQNWAFSAKISKTTAMLSMRYTNVLGLFTGPDAPSDYARGTVYGELISAKQPDGSTYPLEGVRVKIGAVSALTDKNGYYHLNGIPSNQPVLFEIDNKTLGPSNIPEQFKTPLYLQSADILELNPKFNIAVGFDGSVYSNKPLPEDLDISVENIQTGITKIFPVEAIDGFFYIPAIAPGSYEIELVGVDNPPAPLLFSIGAKDEWISDLELFWHQQ